jgi:peptide deformylase
MQTPFPASHDKPLHILTLPDARLRRVAEAVDSFGEDVLRMFTQLETAMRAGPGGVGIAAPQLGINRRMLTVDCSLARHPCRNHGLLQMANPVIAWRAGEKVLGREGCLSVPEWVGMVRRAKSVRVRFQDVSGVSCEIEATGFEARVIQHEIDHLDGVLFIDRVVSIQDLVRRMSRS